MGIGRRACRPFGRLSRENGLWESMSLVLYWTAAMLHWRESRGAEPAGRRAWLAVIAFYVLMGFEEIDYFGIFGGIIGRIDGIYAGSLHDLIMLVKRGVLQPVVLAGLAMLAVVALAILWRKGILVPSLFLKLAARREIAWLLAGLALLFTAAAEEARILGWVAAPPTPEEAVELAGALCLAVYALELAAEGLPVAGPQG